MGSPARLALVGLLLAAAFASAGPAYAAGARTEASVANAPSELVAGGWGASGAAAGAWAAVDDGNGAADVQRVTFVLDLPGGERTLEPDAWRASGTQVRAAAGIAAPGEVDGVAVAAADGAGASRTWTLPSGGLDGAEPDADLARPAASEGAQQPAGLAGPLAAVAAILAAGLAARGGRNQD